MFAPHTNPESRNVANWLNSFEQSSPRIPSTSSSEYFTIPAEKRIERYSRETDRSFIGECQMEIPRKSAPLKIPQKRLQTSSALFDPNLSSPPNEFIQKLKLRMDVYFDQEVLTPGMNPRR